MRLRSRPVAQGGVLRGICTMPQIACARRPLKERPVVGTALDDGVNDTRHLGGNCGQRFAAQIGIVAISGDIALEFITEAVVRWRIATCPASHSALRNRALPY